MEVARSSSRGDDSDVLTSELLTHRASSGPIRAISHAIRLASSVSRGVRVRGICFTRTYNKNQTRDHARETQSSNSRPRPRPRRSRRERESGSARVRSSRETRREETRDATRRPDPAGRTAVPPHHAPQAQLPRARRINVSCTAHDIHTTVVSHSTLAHPLDTEFLPCDVLSVSVGIVVGGCRPAGLFSFIQARKPLSACTYMQ